tara:strand:- start:765 stop:1244 length:480 start_codon:yes stop_codon:yes gene_type:complete
MKHKKIKLSILLLCFGGALNAQSANTASGGEATGTGGSVSYSIGQIAYTSNTSDNGTVSQGVQQPYEIYTVGIQETALEITLSVFPNPTVNDLTLQIGNYNNEELSYQLYDMQGRLLNTGKVTETLTPIETAQLPSSTYFINVVDQKSKKIQTFKVIKN